VSTKAAAAATATAAAAAASNQLFRFARQTVEVAARTTPQVASAMIHLMTTRLFSCLLYFAVVKLGPCVEIHSSAFELSITGVLVVCAV